MYVRNDVEDNGNGLRVLQRACTHTPSNTKATGNHWTFLVQENPMRGRENNNDINGKEAVRWETAYA